MASVRMQIFAAVETKLQAVVAALGWATMLRNPREPIGEDQMNAIIQMDGGDREPTGLTGLVSQCEAEFSIALMVRERGDASVEDLLDAGFVAVSNAVLDPDDIQLSGLAIGVRRLGVSDPSIGRATQGSRVMGGQAIDFAVQYLEREGDAETPGP